MSYQVEEFLGCTIVTGSVPIMEMVAIMTGSGENAVMDPGMAKVYGAGMVIGTPENLEKLRKSPRTLELSHAKATSEAGNSNLSEDAMKWLEFGERGSSSEAIFSRITGITLDGEVNTDHPLDGDDFRRCRLLLEAVPEFQAKLTLMKDVSTQWHSLVNSWQELCDVMDAEAPQWRERKGTSRNLNDKMAEFLE